MNAHSVYWRLASVPRPILLAAAFIGAFQAAVIVEFAFYFARGPFFWICQDVLSKDGYVEFRRLAYLRVLLALLLLFLSFVTVYGSGPVFAAAVKALRPHHVLFYTIALGNILAYYLLSRLDVPLFLSVYAEDSVGETIGAILFLVASLLFLGAATRRALWRTSTGRLCAIVALVLFLFSMEEMSWAQRLIGFVTPSLFQAHNFQGETNLHNLFNPALPLLYPLFCFAVGVGLLHADKVLVSRWKSLRFLAPGPAFIPFAVMFLAFSVYGENEIIEENFALVMVLYAYELFRRARTIGRAGAYEADAGPD